MKEPIVTAEELETAIQRAVTAEQELFEATQKIDELEDRIEDLEAELETSEEEQPMGKKMMTIDTGNDIIEIYMLHGNLLDLSRLEKVQKALSVPNLEPQLF